MRHITIICDYCATTIYDVAIITGGKYNASYSSTRLKTEGINSEYCNTNCMMTQLTAGKTNPVAQEGMPGKIQSGLPPSSVVPKVGQIEYK